MAENAHQMQIVAHRDILLEEIVIVPVGIVAVKIVTGAQVRFHHRSHQAAEIHHSANSPEVRANQTQGDAPAEFKEYVIIMTSVVYPQIITIQTPTGEGILQEHNVLLQTAPAKLQAHVIQTPKQIKDSQTVQQIILKHAVSRITTMFLRHNRQLFLAHSMQIQTMFQHPNRDAGQTTPGK